MNDQVIEIEAALAKATAERDEAQSCVQALMQVLDGLEAHIMDRAAMDDPAKPKTYLSILRADMARVPVSTHQICAARWADYRRQSDVITRLSTELKELREKVGAMREALCAAEIVMASIIGRGGVAEGGEQNGNMVDLVAAYSHVATALGQALSPKPPKLSGYQQAVKDVQEAIAEGGDREQ